MANLHPYGSSPDTSDTDEYVDEIDTETPDETAEPTEPQAKEESNPSEDYKTRYEELRKLDSRRGNELGELRKQYEALQQQMEESKGREKAARNEPPPDDTEQKIQELADKWDNGDITQKEYSKQLSLLIRNQTLQEIAPQFEEVKKYATDSIADAFTRVESDKLINKFHQENPGFQEFQQSAEAEAMRQANPLLEDVSLFYLSQVNAAKAEAQAAFEKGKQEALRVKSGSNRAGEVLSDPGTSMQTQRKNTRPTDFDIQQSMIRAARKAG